MPIIHARDPRIPLQRQLVTFFWGLPWAGKTYSILSIGTSLATLLKKGNGKSGDGRLCVIDTEHASTLDYSEKFDFDFYPLDPPYAPERFVKALQEIAAQGYSVIAIDQIGAEWGDAGGVLRQIDTLKESTKSNPWQVMTPRHDALLAEMNRMKIPILCTCRSDIKTAIQNQVDDRGNTKAVPVKLGEKPKFRPEDEYDFKVIAKLEQLGDGTRAIHFTGKCRVPALDGKTFINPGKDVAEIMAAWIKPGMRDDETPQTGEKTVSEPPKDEGQAVEQTTPSTQQQPQTTPPPEKAVEAPKEVVPQQSTDRPSRVIKMRI